MINLNKKERRGEEGKRRKKKKRPYALEPATLHLSPILIKLESFVATKGSNPLRRRAVLALSSGIFLGGLSLHAS